MNVISDNLIHEPQDPSESLQSQNRTKSVSEVAASNGPAMFSSVLNANRIFAFLQIALCEACPAQPRQSKTIYSVKHY